MVDNITVYYCCKRVTLYAKKLKEAKTEKTRLFCRISIRGAHPLGPLLYLATPMTAVLVLVNGSKAKLFQLKLSLTKLRKKISPSRNLLNQEKIDHYEQQVFFNS